MAAAPVAPCRSSAVLNYAISGQEISKFCTRIYARPSIITLTAVAGPADPRVDRSQRRGCFYYAYSQVSAPPSRIIGTVGSKGGSSAPNEQQGPQKARRQLPPLPLC